MSHLHFTICGEFTSIKVDQCEHIQQRNKQNIVLPWQKKNCWIVVEMDHVVIVQKYLVIGHVFQSCSLFWGDHAGSEWWLIIMAQHDGWTMWMAISCCHVLLVKSGLFVFWTTYQQQCAQFWTSPANCSRRSPYGAQAFDVQQLHTCPTRIKTNPRCFFSKHPNPSIWLIARIIGYDRQIGGSEKDICTARLAETLTLASNTYQALTRGRETTCWLETVTLVFPHNQCYNETHVQYFHMKP